jgi:hypothetical protein
MELDETAAPNPVFRATAPPKAQSDDGGFKAFGDDGLTFFDILDIINPLHHIPIVSTLYRAWTGDEIDPVPRIAGGGLFGGLIGAVASLVDVVIEEFTGGDIGDHVLALFEGEDDSSGGAVANADVPPSPLSPDYLVTAAGGEGEPPSLAFAAGLYRIPLVAHVGGSEWAGGDAAFMAATADAHAVGRRIDIHA